MSHSYIYRHLLVHEGLPVEESSAGIVLPFSLFIASSSNDGTPVLQKRRADADPVWIAQRVLVLLKQLSPSVASEPF